MESWSEENNIYICRYRVAQKNRTKFIWYDVLQKNWGTRKLK